jgi:hypothetical protein
VIAESLPDQLRRIGALAAVCVVAALALGTFAVLKRVVPSGPASAPTATPHPVHVHIAVAPVAAGAAATAAGDANDPITASQAQTLKNETGAEQQQARLYRRQAKAVNAGLTALSRRSSGGAPRSVHHGAVPSASTAPAASATKPAPSNSAKAKSDGGAGLAPR